MPAGYPVKVNYLTGDVLTAADLNDLAGTVNLYDPTAKGDLFPASSADAVSRLEVGANATVLTADSTAATGMKWAAGGASALNLATISSGSLTGTTMSFTGLTQDTLVFKFLNATSTSAGQDLKVNLNSDTTTKYNQMYRKNSQTLLTVDPVGTPGTYIYFPAAESTNGQFTFTNCKSTAVKQFTQLTGRANSSEQGAGTYSGTSAVTSLQMQFSAGNFSTGTYILYGA